MSKVKMPKALTPVHCVTFPLLTIAVLEGFTEAEQEDLCNTIVALSGDGGLFAVSDETAATNWNETMDWFKSMDYKEAIATAIKCCDTIHEKITNENARNAIIGFIVDTVNADGKVTEQEKILAGMFTTVILNGSKS
jgi:hypothetical protein